MKNRRKVIVGICTGMACLVSAAIVFDDICTLSCCDANFPSKDAPGSGSTGVSDAPMAATRSLIELSGVQVDAEFQELARKMNLETLPSDPANDESLWKLKYSDPRNFALLEWHDGIPYRLVRRMFSEDSVGTFCNLLDDPAYAPHWSKIARIIAFISTNEDSAKKILQYIERRDDWTRLAPRELDRRISEKLGTLRMLGLYSTNWSEEILRQGLTREGAQSLIKQWSEAIPQAIGQDRAIILLQGSAAMGLIYTQKPENLDMVRKMYEHEHTLCQQQQTPTKLHGQLVDAMAFQEVTAEIGMDEYWRLYGTNELIQKTLLATRKYMYKASR